jgi:hypothetical protein
MPVLDPVRGAQRRLAKVDAVNNRRVVDHETPAAPQ